MPVAALCAVAAVSLLFVFIGDVNSLGPVVTMPFMLTYASVDYAYFVLAMSFDWRRKHPPNYLHDGIDGDLNYGAFGSGEAADGSAAGLFNTSRGDGQSAVDRDVQDASESTKMVDGGDSAAGQSGTRTFIISMIGVVMSTDDLRTVEAEAGSVH